MAKAGSGKNRAQEEWVVDEHTQSWFRALNEELQGLGGSDLAPVNLLLERLKNKQSMLDAKPKEERRFFLKGGLRKNRRQIHRDEQRHYRNSVMVCHGTSGRLWTVCAELSDHLVRPVK
jgi:hypothetical protein